jgi:Ca2+-binding RTX toxin-like protein
MGKPVKVTKVTINGNQFDNIINGSDQPDDVEARGLIINGNAGNDTLKGGSGADILNGGDGNDYVYGDHADLAGAGDGTTVWDGGKGIDTIDLSQVPYEDGLGTYLKIGTGLPGSSSQIWTNVDNPDGTLWGFDTAEAKYVNNVKGFENVVMGGGDDWVDMASGTGNNTVNGGGGNDVLNAGDGNDIVIGGDGNDMVIGGWGDDQLTGGAGSDMFVFLGRLAGQFTRDTIADFDIDGSDGAADALWLGESYTVQWDPNSAALHGYMFDNGTAIGEITLLGLNYTDASSVQIYYGIDMTTGGPVGLV